MEEVLRHKSLIAQNHALSDPSYQKELIEGVGLIPFEQKLSETHLFPLHALKLETLQINLGKMCNQVCNHCHVDAGPDRKEIMTRETMQSCLDVIRKQGIGTVDLTGGAPEMNPDFRWFVEALSALGVHIMVRCNLTIITAHKKYNDLPEFFARHGVEVISSLPCYTESNTDAQRGEGVFTQSIQALKMLNAVGYGREGSPLVLNLVYNPGGPGIAGNQAALEADYKRVLAAEYGIVFSHLFTITNLPISRFLHYLVASGNYETYMEKLIAAFNPDAAKAVMCRTTLSVSWDGYLYDCDFNQMLDLKCKTDRPHISTFDAAQYPNREIIVNQHCYGCTAGAGSSCGGAITN
jgi:radical SAM/Cys-rich protein